MVFKMHLVRSLIILIYSSSDDTSNITSPCFALVSAVGESFTAFVLGPFDVPIVLPFSPSIYTYLVPTGASGSDEYPLPFPILNCSVNFMHALTRY